MLHRSLRMCIFLRMPTLRFRYNHTFPQSRQIFVLQHLIFGTWTVTGLCLVVTYKSTQAVLYLKVHHIWERTLLPLRCSLLSRRTFGLPQHLHASWHYLTTMSRGAVSRKQSLILNVLKRQHFSTLALRRSLWGLHMLGYWRRVLHHLIFLNSAKNCGHCGLSCASTSRTLLT